jgi:uncharacterized protein
MRETLKVIKETMPGEDRVGETELILFRRSSIHGTGGFAKTNIPTGTRIIEYVGNKISKQESLRHCEENNEYIFTLNEEHDLDGNVEWNLARFINHSCEPNCDAVIEDNLVWIVANRPLSAGEEITYNYNFDLEDYKEYLCNCGSPACIGYIIAEDFFEQVRNQRELAAAKPTI